ncbi:MAG: hypothetical protein LUC24_04855 [Bacteroidales bacterium]|nr:hypothetical protein [Bacteroidales bacterium]
MAIRSNSIQRGPDLHPELRDILMRNGLQAHIVSDGEGYQLVVQGHDSPLLRYRISDQQLLALTDWGTNYADKKAYDTLTGIIAGDFDLPRDFVHARNANGRVAMGLHGYRTEAPMYGRGGYGMSPYFLGWTPRQQGGYHLRRVGGQLFYGGPSMVAERPDGRMKPGELQSGAYGFYYKGAQQTASNMQSVSQDVLQDLQAVITPMVSRPRSVEPALAYDTLISSPVYFSNEKWQECLTSHGIIVDAEKRTLTVQSERVSADMVYDLTDQELAVLTSNSIEDHPIDRRLETLNNVIRDDFADRITLDALNGTDRISLLLHPEVEQDISFSLQMQQEQSAVQENDETLQDTKEGASVDGRDLSFHNEGKGWYNEGSHGREAEVSSITVGPAETEGKYRMTAVINGEAITHEITQRQYEKFLAVDDYHRMKLFSRIFNEVDMKTRPEVMYRQGTRIFAALAAGTVALSEIIRDIHGPRPELYGERTVNTPRPYFKPGVDTPSDVAARNFEARVNQEIKEIHRGI